MLRLLRHFLLSAALLLSPAPAAALADVQQQRMADLLHGYLLSAEGKYAEAATRIGEVGIAEKDSDILASAVMAALQAQDVQLAKRYTNAWVAFGGGTPARQTMAELYLVGGELSQAEQLLARLIEEGAEGPEELFHQLHAVDDRKAAVEMGKRLFPQTAEGLYYLARLAISNGEGAFAETAVARARQAAPARLDILFLAGRIAQQEHGDVAPLAVLEEFVNDQCAGGAVRHCTLDGVLWAFADYLRRGEEWQEGLNANQPDAAAWAVSAGNWYEQWEMPARARAAYHRADGAFMAQLGLARLAEAEGDFAAALRILEHADVGTSREFSRRETTIAYLLSEQGKLAPALARVKDAQRTLPENFNLLYHESLLLEEMGDVNGAVAVLRHITKVFPDNANGWNALGYVMADHNIRLGEAKEYIERALSVSPDDPNIIDSLGWVYYRMGNLARARVQLQKAAGLSQAAEIHAHYGEVLWELGDTGEAQRVWEQAKARHPDNELLNETIARYRR